MRDYMAEMMERVFGEEWLNLKLGHERELIIQDATDASDEDGCSMSEYAGRIGKGNLQAYVNCLVAGEPSVGAGQCRINSETICDYLGL